MRAYILRRLLAAIPTLLAVTLLVFLVMQLIPGDPAVIMAGELADAVTLNAIRHKWGLDQPLPVQSGVFLVNLARGDLGVSLRTGLPVLAEILRRYEVTLVLALLGAAVAVSTGLLLGILGATRAYTVWDYAGTVLALLGISTPVFWSGMLLNPNFLRQVALASQWGDGFYPALYPTRSELGPIYRRGDCPADPEQPAGST